ncbi:MAG TPA: PEP-CTERM sorting domain-containing protein, partial [Phycisphaerales bacterium]|nr:PEP-CTERM sorting domain-containing protein [Phycisphaerales bacterium]
GLSLVADQGAGTLNLADWTGTFDNFGGSALNAISPDGAGASLSLVAGGSTGGPYPGNGSYIEFTISMSGMQDLVLSFATRGTSTGFNSGTWSYSTGGGFTALSDNTATTSTSFAVKTVDFSAYDDMDNVSSVVIRYTLDGASGTTGNNRIDNIQFNASVVPAPGALALLGLAGVAARRRRRAN